MKKQGKMKHSCTHCNDTGWTVAKHWKCACPAGMAVRRFGTLYDDLESTAGTLGSVCSALREITAFSGLEMDANGVKALLRLLARIDLESSNLSCDLKALLPKPRRTAKKPAKKKPPTT